MDLSPIIWMLQDRLRLRGKEKRLAGPAVVERFLAQPVPREEQRAIFPIPNPEDKHPVESAEGGLNAPALEGRQHHLGVRVPPEGVALPLQLRSQGAKVVDLAVVGQHVAAAGRDHWLVSSGAAVDDREPAVGQRDARLGVRPQARVVGAPVREGGAHLGDDLLDRLGAALERDESSYSAHGIALGVPVAPENSRKSLSPDVHITLRPRVDQRGVEWAESPARTQNGPSLRIIVNALAAVVGGGATSLRPLVSALPAVDGGRHSYEIVARADLAAAADFPDPRVSVVGLRQRSLAERLYHEQVWLPLRARRTRADAILTISSPPVFASPVPQAVMFRNALPFQPDAYKDYRGVERARCAALRTLGIAGARAAQKVVFISRAQRDLILPQLHLPADRTACVYLGRSLEFNPTAREHAAETLDRYGIRQPYLLTVSQFYKYKKLVELVEAFAIAIPKLPPDASLVLAGAEIERDYAARVHGAIGRTGLGSRIKLVGAVPHKDLPALYAAASIFAFTSTCESFPNILVEAMASGVPTLASSDGPMGELGGDGAGQFDPRSATDMAERITELWNDPAARRRLSVRGPARAAVFSWEATARGLLDLLEEIA